MEKVALITGITGQDGAYLAEFLLKDKRGTLHEMVSDVLSFEAKKLMFSLLNHL